MKLADFAPGGAYQVGRVVGAVSATYTTEQTEPPERYTQASLMDDMMAAHKFATSESDRATLRQIDGLGTARTREPTITNLITRGFLEVRKAKRGKQEYLVPTATAREIARHLPPMLTDVGTTAKWELAFRLIEQGKASAAQAREYLKATLARVVADAKAKTGQITLAAAPVAPKTNQFAQRAPAAASGAASKSTAAAAGVGGRGRFGAGTARA